MAGKQTVATTPPVTFLRKAERVAARNTLILKCAHDHAATVDVTPTDNAGWRVEYEAIIALVNAKCGRTGQDNAYRWSSVKALHNVVAGYYAPHVEPESCYTNPCDSTMSHTSAMHTSRKAFTAWRKAHGLTTNTRDPRFHKLTPSEKRDALANYRDDHAPTTPVVPGLPAGTTFKVNADGTFTVC